MQGKNKKINQKGTTIPTLMIIAILTIGVFTAIIQVNAQNGTDSSNPNELETFSNYQDLTNFVKIGVNDTPSLETTLPPKVFNKALRIPAIYWGIQSGLTYRTMPTYEAVGGAKDVSLSAERDYVSYQVPGSSPENPESHSSSSNELEHSTTNIQVGGVDETDIIKIDEKYIYAVSKEKVTILRAYPPKNSRILSKIRPSGKPEELFINKNKLITIGHKTESSGYPGETKTIIEIYNISNRKTPTKQKEISITGNYFDSRMINNQVYLIINQPVNREKIELPKISSDNQENTIPASEIHHFETPAHYYRFTTILSINLEEMSVSKEAYLMERTQNMYVSKKNIYITNQNRNRQIVSEQILSDTTATLVSETNQVEKTTIHRISIKDGEIQYAARGEVPGRVLNQFSMSEHKDYFRIATTTGHVARYSDHGTAKNHVFILNQDLEIVGKLKNLAPGEKIYSARFMGDKAYLVTFKKVDPLFVLDLENPTNPKILGKLKIPGYSDYLHPYDENHLIGIGKSTVAAESGNFAWYQGIKIALFDVTDVNNPKQISKYIIGDRGTESLALKEHKAFLFSRSKNLLSIPITLAEIKEEKYPNDVPPNMRGEYTWQGSYLLNIDAEDGLSLKGRISHLENREGLLKSGYYYSSPYSIKRTHYIENSLYTYSKEKIKINNLNNLSEINEINL